MKGMMFMERVSSSSVSGVSCFLVFSICSYHRPLLPYCQLAVAPSLMHTKRCCLSGSDQWWWWCHLVGPLPELKLRATLWPLMQRLHQQNPTKTKGRLSLWPCTVVSDCELLLVTAKIAYSVGQTSITHTHRCKTLSARKSVACLSSSWQRKR